MIYLATPSGAAVCAAIEDGRLGQMVTHRSQNRVRPGAVWALDNGVVKIEKGRPVTDPSWSPVAWSAYLERLKGVPGCLFACVPDAVGDAAETDRLWAAWWSAPMRRGYRAAYVAQNGCQRIPWGARAVFLGGDDEFKLGDEGRAVVAEAKGRGLWVHMGRVNTRGRLVYAHAIGCDSVDGTTLGWGPDRNLPSMLRWLEELDRPRLFAPASP